MSTLPKGPRGVIRVSWQSARDPIGSAERWRQQYGDPMTYPDYEGKPLLVVGSPAAIRSVFGAPPETFEPALAERLDASIGEGSLLTLKGTQHTAMRKLLMPPFHGQRMRVYGKQIRDITLEQLRDFKPGSRFVAQDMMDRISLQTIIQLVFGVTGHDRVAFAEKLVGNYRRAGTRAIIPILFPALRREFWGFGPWAALQRARQALHDLIAEELTRRRAEPAERTDILSLLLSARYEDGTPLSDPQIYAQMLTLLFAGHSTTSLSLSFALYLLSQEREVLARLQSELAALGPDPEPETLAKAPFLEAVCHETLRLYPIFGGTARKLVAPMQIAGHDLPAGAGVVVNILWAHRNPEVFPQPERFLPDRFLGRTYSPFEFMPFGGGNRRCIGAALALYEMKIVLGTMLSRFAYEHASKKPLRVIQLISLEPSGPLRMIVRPLASGLS